jgi:hypothetical protein
MQYKKLVLLFSVFILGCVNRPTYKPYTGFDRINPVKRYIGIVDASFFIESNSPYLYINMKRFDLLQEYYYSPDQIERKKIGSSLFNVPLKSVKLRIEGLDDQEILYYIQNSPIPDLIKIPIPLGLHKENTNTIVVYCMECASETVPTSTSNSSRDITFKNKIEMEETLQQFYKRYSQLLESEKNNLIKERRQREIQAQKVQRERQQEIEKEKKVKAEATLKQEMAKKNQFDTAKNKCINLGFKTGTEAMGKCVLELTK